MATPILTGFSVESIDPVSIKGFWVELNDGDYEVVPVIAPPINTQTGGQWFTGQDDTGRTFRRSRRRN